MSGGKGPGNRLRRIPAPVVDAGLVAVAGVDVWINVMGGAGIGTAWAVLGCAALAWRRRFPLAVLMLTLPITATQFIAVAPSVALFTLAERSPCGRVRRRRRHHLRGSLAARVG
jgi:hypothetical protein